MGNNDWTGRWVIIWTNVLDREKMRWLIGVNEFPDYRSVLFKIVLFLCRLLGASRIQFYRSVEYGHQLGVS